MAVTGHERPTEKLGTTAARAVLWNYLSFASGKILVLVTLAVLARRMRDTGGAFELISSSPDAHALLAQVEAWLSGEQDSEAFQRLVAVHKRRKYHLQVRQADRLRGQRAYELRLAAYRDLQTG